MDQEITSATDRALFHQKLPAHIQIMNMKRNAKGATSAKTRFPSSNLFSLLYPQTQKNEMEVSLKYGIALTFQSVL